MMSHDYLNEKLREEAEKWGNFLQACSKHFSRQMQQETCRKDNVVPKTTEGEPVGGWDGQHKS